MNDLIIRAIAQAVPVDIYFRIDIDGRGPRCLLYYPSFLITGIDQETNTFEGYTIQERRNPVAERTLTSDSIGLICNIYGPYLEIE